MDWSNWVTARTFRALFGRAKAVSAAAVNRLRACRSPVWHAGFHDRAVRREESLLAAARYLVANPIAAGLANSPGEYPFWGSVWPGIEEDPI